MKRSSYCHRVQGGIYWVVLLDHYVSYWSLLVIGLLTCVCVGWVYTVPAISTNIRAMLGSEPGWFWKVCWKFLSPIILLVSTRILKRQKMCKTFDSSPAEQSLHDCSFRTHGIQ